MTKRIVPKAEGELAGTVLRIPVADWLERYTQEEPDLSNIDKAIELLKERGYPPATMGILCLVGGLRGEASEEVAIFPKTALLVGISQTISHRIAALKAELETSSGQTITVRRIVPYVHIPTLEDEDDGEEMALDVVDISPRLYSYVESGTQEALNRAELYLLQRIPGYIYGRLKIIAVSGGDVEAVADMLKDKIDELVEKLA